MWLRLILGLVYLGMAIGQLASWADLPGILVAYQVGGTAAMRGLAVILIAGELACGVWFLTHPRARSATPVWIYTAVALVWATLGVQAFLRGLDVANCGCFGNYLTQRLSWFVLLQDALLLAYAVLLIRGVHQAKTTSRETTR